MVLRRTCIGYCASLVVLAAACNGDRRGQGSRGGANLDAFVSDGSSAADLGTPESADLGASSEDMPAASDVHVVITADNAYAFGWGDANQVTNLLGRPPTNVAGDIFNCPVGAGPVANVGPEAYDVPAANATGYLYIVTWADDSVTQGVIGEFDRGGSPLYTGDPAWQVCATGLAYDPSGGATSGGPSAAVVNQEIGGCNAGSIATNGPTPGSGGWTDVAGAVTAGAVGTLAVGEDNSDQSGEFPIACQKDANGVRGIDAAARWMWYQPPGVSTPFQASGQNNTRSFLIFRLKSDAVPIL